jgi:uncharacterized protein YecT (DUF1311 family)
MKILLVIMFIAITTLLIVNANAQQYLEGRVTSSDVIERPSIHSLLKSQIKMDTLYDKLAQKLDDIGKNKLSIAQKSWKKYSQAECDFTVNYSPAQPLHPISYNECLLVMNIERTTELEYQLQWMDLLDPGMSLNKHFD